MSDGDIALLRAEISEIKADLAETQKMARETRDVLLQASGGMVVLRWLLGGTLASALAVSAMIYTYIRGH